MGEKSQEVIFGQGGVRYIVGKVIIGKLNVQKAVLLATCLVEGGSQRGPGVVSTIQGHARHGGRPFSSRYQNKIDIP